MTKADLELIDKSIETHGDDFWNEKDQHNDNVTNRSWIIAEILELLEKDDFDLKVVRKKRD